LEPSIRFLYFVNGAGQAWECQTLHIAKITTA
jgi:hypothetical protein